MVGSVFLTAAALATEPRSIQWREAFVTVEREFMPIEGLEGHAVGVMRQRGFAFYDDGEVATVKVWLTFERSGPGTGYRGYAVYRFPDGSTKVARFTGAGDPEGRQSGEFVLDSGSGRFDGISGDGRFAGRGFPPHGDIYLDVSGTYSLPAE